MGITHRKRNAWLAEVRPLAHRAADVPHNMPAIKAAAEAATDRYLTRKGVTPGTGQHAEAYRNLMAFVRPREPMLAAFSERVEAARLRKATVAGLRTTLRAAGEAMVSGKYADAALHLSRAEVSYLLVGEGPACKQALADTHEERLVASELAEAQWACGATRLARLLITVDDRPRGDASRAQLGALAESLERLLTRMWFRDPHMLRDAPELADALTTLLERDTLIRLPRPVQTALFARIAPELA